MYEIRDHTHPETHPLGTHTRATATTYPEALAAIHRLHQDCHQQIQTNGEGGTVDHRLVLVDVTDPATPTLAGIHQYTAAGTQQYGTDLDELLVAAYLESTSQRPTVDSQPRN